MKRKPNVVVVADTSMSMGEAEGQRVLTECNSIIKAINTELTFIAHDAKSHGVQVVKSINEIEFRGGGGTNFVTAFDTINDERLDPDVVVFVTDGQGAAPVAKPGNYETIWILVGQHRRVPYANDGSRASVTWGEVIEIDEEDLSRDNNRRR